MKTKCVVIGAGQTGRGYINRILNLNGLKCSFLDINQKLIDELNKSESYRIDFGSSGRAVIELANYEAFNIETNEGIEELSNADIVFTAVGAGEIGKLVSPIKQSLDIRQKKSPIYLMTCENGVGVSSSFGELLLDDRIQITEGIVFCTTLNQGLDIYSEDYDSVPYDSLKWDKNLDLSNFHPTTTFSDLMERKIYTYNCISAVVAYLGYILKYEDYATAANDPLISESINKIRVPLDNAISKKYNVDPKEQEEFSSRAVIKFKNTDIKDTINRNTRDSNRKLSANERIMAPLKLIYSNGGSSKELLNTCAAACYYGLVENEFGEEELTHILESVPTEWQDEVIRTMEKIKNGEDIFR